MPFTLQLPTTSSLSFQSHFRCSTHPSLLFRATAARNLVQSRLKSHKHILHDQSASNLASVVAALNAYVPLLLSLSNGLSSSFRVADEEIDIELIEEILVRWRSSIMSSQLVGLKQPKISVTGLDAEVAFTLSALATANYLQAKARLRALYDTTKANGALSIEQRGAIITPSMNHLINAHSIYNYLATIAIARPLSRTSTEISEPVASALSSLALSEATLLAVLRDDPYPNIIAAERNVCDTDWMISAPKIPKIRAHLFARICVAAANHARCGFASANIGNSKSLNNTERKACEALTSYLDALTCVAMSKACRFAAIGADADGALGKAIGWLYVALQQCGIRNPSTGSRSGARQSKAAGMVSALKRAREEKTEDRRIEKDGDWGSDGGRLEEIRVVEMLLAKWERLNDTVVFQRVENVDQLLAELPSGREYHTSKTWTPPSLSAGDMASMRAPIDANEAEAKATSTLDVID